MTLEGDALPLFSYPIVEDEIASAFLLDPAEIVLFV
jgi:hypothetical protein